MSACSVSAVSTRQDSPRSRKPASSRPFEMPVLVDRCATRGNRDRDQDERIAEHAVDRVRVIRPDDRRPLAGGGSRAGNALQLERRARVVGGQDPEARPGRRSSAARRECRRRPARAPSRRRLAGISGVSGISIRGIKAQGTVVVGQDFQDDAYRKVSTRVAPMYAEKREPPPEPDEHLGRWILGGVVLIALAAGIWFWQKRQPAEDAPPVTAEAIATDEPKILHPIEPDDDDGRICRPPRPVATLVGTPRFEAMFVPDDFVRRIVATVDNLPRQNVAMQLTPAKPPAGNFVDRRREDNRWCSAPPISRAMRPWIELVDSLDAGRDLRVLPAAVPAVPGGLRESRQSGRLFQRPRDRGHRPPARDAGAAGDDHAEAAERALRIRRSRRSRRNRRAASCCCAWARATPRASR